MKLYTDHTVVSRYIQT